MSIYELSNSSFSVESISVPASNGAISRLRSADDIVDDSFVYKFSISLTMVLSVSTSSSVPMTRPSESLHLRVGLDVQLDAGPTLTCIGMDSKLCGPMRKDEIILSVVGRKEATAPCTLRGGELVGVASGVSGGVGPVVLCRSLDGDVLSTGVLPIFDSASVFVLRLIIMNGYVLRGVLLVGDPLRCTQRTCR